MKKHLIIGVLVLCCVPMAFATLITNANQSALYFRLLARNASTDIDAVYYNPAGLTRLKDGFHVGLHNQTIFQEKKVTNEFPLLNHDSYQGDVNVPVFPDVYFVYKKGPVAVSFGFGPNSGGGTADFKKGVPSFEAPFAEIPSLLSLVYAVPTTSYAMDMSFKLQSVYYGFQANFSYALNDMLAVAVGGRYISATNKYEGSIKNVRINPYGIWYPAPVFFAAVNQPVLALLTADKAVDVKQTGTGFTPILSLNLHPIEGLNISAKYEFITKLTLANETTVDGTGMFPDGEENRNDIPAILSFGIEYALMPQLRGMVSFNYFFDKSAQWDQRDEAGVIHNRADLVNSNTFDLGFGLEYDVNKMFTVSAGYLWTRFDLSEAYQSDVSHEIPNSTVGAGARIRLGEKLDIDLSGIYTIYSSGTQKTIDYGLFGAWLEKYDRTNFAFAIGLGYHF